MTDGFQDPITAGTNLVIPAINSPNYVLAVSGWAVRIDGTAQFTGLVLIGGTFTGTTFIMNNSGSFFYSGTPAAGNLIASIASASGTDSFGNHYNAGITSYDTAFGGVTQLNGATFQLFSGTNLLHVINAKGHFFYSPNAAANNLVASIAPAAGTDPYGNAYLSGFTVYGPATIPYTGFNALQLQNAAGQIGMFYYFNTVSMASWTPAGQLILTQASQWVMGSAGQLNPLLAYGGVQSVLAEGNTYDTERLTLRTTATTFSGTGFVTVPGLTKHVGTGTYRFRAHLMYVGNGTGTVGNPVFKVTGPASAGSLNFIGQGGAGVPVIRFDNASGFGSALTGAQLPAGDSTTRFDVVIEGSAVFSAAGTLAVLAAISGAGTAQFVIATGSTLDIEPVVAT